jgi:hypothetical protein
MTTPFRDYRNYFMGSDMESFVQSLQEVVKASPHSAGTLPLRFYKLESGLVILLLKNQTEELP